MWNIHENITIKHGYINNDVDDQLWPTYNTVWLIMEYSLFIVKFSKIYIFWLVTCTMHTAVHYLWAWPFSQETTWIVQWTQDPASSNGTSSDKAILRSGSDHPTLSGTVSSNRKKKVSKIQRRIVYTLTEFRKFESFSC